MKAAVTSRPPRHIAIIMDGNGRWAKERGLPRSLGHRAGAESVRECVDACKELGVEFLTLYAFSSENWKRPQNEVDSLMKLLEKFLRDKKKELMEWNVRLQAIGRLTDLPENCRRALDETIDATSSNTSLTLILALSYGGREEIIDAVQSVLAATRDGKLTTDAITTTEFSRHLYTRDIPDPDLLIRTSGEMRVSNFLLWQISYTEMVVVKKNWPDFKRGDIFAAVEEYQSRHRRFGGI